jgi:hypothetical protein
MKTTSLPLRDDAKPDAEFQAFMDDAGNWLVAVSRHYRPVGGSYFFTATYTDLAEAMQEALARLPSEGGAR